MKISKIAAYLTSSLILATGLVMFNPAAAQQGTTTAAPAPLPLATPAAVEQPATENICGYDYPASPVVSIAADEISRLREVYPSVCATQWAFTAMEGYLGLAYDNAQNLVLISIEENKYTQGGNSLEDVVRHVIRHEFGHQITYETHSAYFPENANALADLFQTTPDLAYEVAAEAMSMVMDPSNSYPRDVTPEQLDAARGLLSTQGVPVV